VAEEERQPSGAALMDSDALLVEIRDLLKQLVAHQETQTALAQCTAENAALTQRWTMDGVLEARRRGSPF
jgi:hypothetical protein